MASAPRSADELRAQLISIFPHWLEEPDELLDAHVRAIAGQFALSQAADQSLHDRAFIGRADGSFLDQHGQERGKFRRSTELEEAFRARVRLVDDKVNRSSILTAVNAVLQTGVATMTEHTPDNPAFVPPVGTTFFSLGIIGKSNSFRSARAYTLAIPDQVPVVKRDTAFTSDTTTLTTKKTRTFTWEAAVSGSAPKPGMYTADVIGPLAIAIYSQVMQILDDLTAAGVEARPIVV